MQKEIKKAVLDFLKDAKPGKILDIPSGTCWLMDELSGQQGWEYFAADLFTSPRAANFKKADLNRVLPYDDGTFDYVACLEGLEHIENYHHTVREFHRVLKPGGTLVVSTPNPLNIKSRLRFLLTGTFYGFPHLVKMPGEGEHLHMTPINVSFLLSFARKYGLGEGRTQPISIKPKMYRFVPFCLLLKAYTAIKVAFKDDDTKRLRLLLVSRNILLNDNVVVTFRKEDGQAAI